MTMGDIKQIESVLSITLPEELVDKYKANVLDGIEEFPDISELFFMKANDLIYLNSRLREKGLWKKPFPEYLFAIGRSNSEYYLVDLRENPLRVFRVMNNKTWAYDPNDLSKNIISVPPHEGIESFIESYPLFYLRMKKDQKRRDELGIREQEMTGDEVNEMLEQMANGTFNN